MFNNCEIKIQTRCTEPLKVETELRGVSEAIYAGTLYGKRDAARCYKIEITSPDILTEASLLSPNAQGLDDYRLGFTQVLYREEVMIEYESICIKTKLLEVPALDIMLPLATPFDGTGHIAQTFTPNAAVWSNSQNLIRTDDAPAASIFVSDPQNGTLVSLRSFSRLMAFRIYLVEQHKSTGAVTLLRRVNWNLYYRLDFQRVFGSKVELKASNAPVVQLGYVLSEALSAPDGAQGVTWGAPSAGVSLDPQLPTGKVAHRCEMEITHLPVLPLGQNRLDPRSLPAIS